MIGRLCIVIVLAACGIVTLSLSANSRDIGQWQNSDQTIRHWFETLMQPDNPSVRCCGEADGYWADKVEVKGDKVYAIITDDRPDDPLGRRHIPVGTRFEVPPHKIKFDRGNPTGHIVIFISTADQVLCYVQGGGV